MKIPTKYQLTYIPEHDLRLYAFKYVEGAKISLDANKVYEDLCQIVQEYPETKLESPDVFEWVKNHPESEMYKGVEWDDDKAAYMYRLHQCRMMITQLVVEPINIKEKLDNVELDEDTRKKLTRKVEVEIHEAPFYHMPGKSGYYRAIDIYNNESLQSHREQLGINDLYKWVAKYGDIPTLEHITNFIKNELSKM